MAFLKSGTHNLLVAPAIGNQHLSTLLHRSSFPQCEQRSRQATGACTPESTSRTARCLSSTELLANEAFCIPCESLTACVSSFEFCGTMWGTNDVQHFKKQIVSWSVAV